MSEEEKKTKQKKDRSVAYPGVPLSEAIEFTLKLRDALGKGPYSREESAKALDHSSLTGPAARKIAALVHYGLLERSGNTYSQSQLSQDILKPLSDESKDAAIKRAAMTPRLFQKLCQKFGGQALPSLLQNIIIREGVSEGAASEVVRIFTETMKFANLLVNGVLTKPVTIEEDDETHNAESHISPIHMETTTRINTAPIQKVPSDKDGFIFEFIGGIQLFVPRTKETSVAIADGELKEARKTLGDFAEKYCAKHTLDQKTNTISQVEE